jgi:hypothetical protein
MKPLTGTLLGLALGLNGGAMLTAPRWWYGAIPGVGATGPFNPHFVKDIGAAYLVVGIALLATVARPSRWTYGAGAAAALFLAFHAAIHFVEAFEDLDTLGDLARDFAGVTAPALLALWIVSPLPPVWKKPHA